jgi:hypothetical protein
VRKASGHVFSGIPLGTLGLYHFTTHDDGHVATELDRLGVPLERQAIETTGS